MPLDWIGRGDDLFAAIPCQRYAPGPGAGRPRMTMAVDIGAGWHCLPGSSGARLPAARAEAVLDKDRIWNELMTRANQGDGQAFHCFLTEVTPPLRSLIRARGRGLPPDLHEDVLQEVLLAIHLKRGSWDGVSPIRPWLYAVARHKVVDAFRKRGRQIHLPIDDVAEMLEAEPGPMPLAARDADRLLGMIDDRSAALVRAVRIEGQSTEDAAEELGVSPGAARVALHRAMKRLSELAQRMK